jgi:hypothetical protein
MNADQLKLALVESGGKFTDEIRKHYSAIGCTVYSDNDVRRIVERNHTATAFWLTPAYLSKDGDATLWIIWSLEEQERSIREALEHCQVYTITLPEDMTDIPEDQRPAHPVMEQIVVTPQPSSQPKRSTPKAAGSKKSAKLKRSPRPRKRAQLIKSKKATNRVAGLWKWALSLIG